MGLEARGDDSGKHEVYSDSDCASHRVDKKTIIGSALMYDVRSWPKFPITISWSMVIEETKKRCA